MAGSWPRSIENGPVHRGQPRHLHLVQGVLAYRPSINLMSVMEGRLGVDLAINDHPDLILLDLDLPDIPGEEVFRLLKAEATTDEIRMSS